MITLTPKQVVALRKLFAGATPIPISPEEKGPDGIRGGTAQSRSAGSCNFCNRWTTEHGGVDHPVLEFRSSSPTGGLVVRVCVPCQVQLAELLLNNLLQGL